MGSVCQNCGRYSDELTTGGCNFCDSQPGETVRATEQELRQFWRDCQGAWFPVQLASPNVITLRDWFAGQAMLAMVPGYSPEEAAEMAYQYADAMEKQRTQK